MDNVRIGTIVGQQVWTGRSWQLATLHLLSFLTRAEVQLVRLNTGGTAEFDFSDVFTTREDVEAERRIAEQALERD